MCGIVGYVGKKEAQEVLLDGLAHLEYRGYDSTGLAVINSSTGKIQIAKEKGRIDGLRKKVSQSPLNGNLGIGHTRWATHGAPSSVNSHPHCDNSGKIALVHNGIIENYLSLKEELKKQGYSFASETDTEVAAVLLGKCYFRQKNLCENNEIAMKNSLTEMKQLLEGSYALCIICEDMPDTIFCTRKDSPLLIGLSSGENVVASDIPAVMKITRNIQLMDDGDVAVITKDSVSLFNKEGNAKELKPFETQWSMKAAEKGGWEHFMLKEINEEPLALKNTFFSYVRQDGIQFRETAFMMNSEDVKKINSITFVACGTAYHAGLIGKNLIEKLARIPVRAELASEFRYSQPIIGENDLVIAISQSGETADTIAAIKEAKKLGAKVAAVTNVVSSSIAREVGEKAVFLTYAGPEIAVASTKAYITQVLVFTLMAIDLAQKNGKLSAEEAAELLKNVKQIPEKAKTLLTDSYVEKVKTFASKHFSINHVFYIGRGIDQALAMEASLKLKEVSYVMSESYAAGELKHGTIALIEEGTLVCAVITQEATAKKIMSAVEEVRSRGASMVVIVTKNIRNELHTEEDEADEIWEIPECRDEIAPMLAVIPAQLFAYFMAVKRGCDVDKPRNLAKSVTVE